MTESTSTAREIPVDLGSSDVDVRPQTRSLPPSTRGRMGKVSGVRIAATGSYVPERIVTNEDLAALGCDSEWIIRRTGIRERRHAAVAQATSDLCYEAAVACMRRTDIDADQIDLIIVATITPDHPTPSTACQLQHRLGSLAPAMDVSAACAGFSYALITAAQFIAAGNSRCALVVGADVMSRIVNPKDKMTYPLFGDGAGAVLLTAESSADGILSYQMGSEGCGGEMLCVPAGGSRVTLTPDVYETGLQYMTMDGRNVYKWAVRVIADSGKQVLEEAEVDASDVDLVVLHQANERIIDSAASELRVPKEKVFVNLGQYGNTSAGSIPLAIDEAVRSGKIQPGDLMLLCGFGAGLAWGTALMRW